jgi:hypothetical protein
VATSVHLRFRDDLNFEADGLVCHSNEQNSVGVEFTRMMFCGSLVRRKSRTLLGRARMPLEAISGLVLLVILLLVLQRDWRLFSSKSVSQPMPLTAPSFSLGSTKADVQAAQGTPTTMTDSVWNYGPSKVHFRDGRVVGWLASPSSPLNVGENRVESAKAKRDGFTIRSTATEVLAVQGSPTELTETVWRYGQSEVYFRKGRVTGWKTHRRIL